MKSRTRRLPIRTRANVASTPCHLQRQYQYYPENAYGPEDSPFLHSDAELKVLHRQTATKPAIAGEFPLEGLVAATHNPNAMSLRQAYEALWAGGYSGGYTWMAEQYYGFDR